MKVFVAFLAILAVVAADHHEGHVHHDGHDYVVKTHEDLLKFREHCSTKLSIPAEMVEKYKRWEYPDEEQTHCYMKCVLEQFGLFDEHHGFDVKKVHHQLVGVHGAVDHSDETHVKIEKCADKNAEHTNSCDWAYRGGMCFIKENLKLVQDSVKV